MILNRNPGVVTATGWAWEAPKRYAEGVTLAAPSLIIALALNVALSLIMALGGCEERPAAVEAQPVPTGVLTSPTEGADAVADEVPSEVFDDAALRQLLESRPEMARFVASPERYRLQVLVGTVARSPTGEATVHQAGYRVDAEYIYPASAIKTFLSVASLAAAAERGGDVDTALGVCDGVHCKAIRDPSNRGRGELTVGHAIRKIQLVSDNDAFGQLFDFVGQATLNESLWELGFSSVRLHHRMGLRPEELGPPPAIGLVLDGGGAVGRRTIALPPTPAARLDVGRAHVDEHGRSWEAPMSFANKNYASLRDLQRLNVALVLPKAAGAVELGLDDAQRAWLVRAMTEHPNDSDNPRSPGPRFGVDAHKPLLVGVRRAIAADRIRHVGKAGRAYGFHVANAYVEDRQSGRGVFVTAAIYVNPNGVVNDNRYSYDGTTAPFMADLGELLARSLLR